MPVPHYLHQKMTFSVIVTKWYLDGLYKIYALHIRFNPTNSLLHAKHCLPFWPISLLKCSGLPLDRSQTLDFCSLVPVKQTTSMTSCPDLPSLSAQTPTVHYSINLNNLKVKSFHLDSRQIIHHWWDTVPSSWTPACPAKFGCERHCSTINIPVPIRKGLPAPAQA